MNPTDVAVGYNKLADFWDGDAFDRTNGIEQHKRAIAFCDQRSRALDVGCGSSGRIIDLLVNRGFSVEGIDISPRMIELAKRRHPQVTFQLADVCDWSPPHDYDFISAWDSIWHVPLKEQKAVLLNLFGCLRPNGVCIFTMGGLAHEAEKRDSAMGPQMYYSTLGIPGTLNLIDSAGCVCRHMEFDQYPEQHVYMIVQRTQSSLSD
jgi:SAM-dependent methyltransferase